MMDDLDTKAELKILRLSLRDQDGQLKRSSSEEQLGLVMETRLRWLI